MARLAHAPQLAGRPGVEIELRSARPFIIGGALAELHVGKESFTLSRYPDDGDTHRLIFILEPSEFDRLENGAPVSVRLGRPPVDARTWVFPPFDRSALR
jgi:hypothetical protein